MVVYRKILTPTSRHQDSGPTDGTSNKLVTGAVGKGSGALAVFVNFTGTQSDRIFVDCRLGDVGNDFINPGLRFGQVEAQAAALVEQVAAHPLERAQHLAGQAQIPG